MADIPDPLTTNWVPIWNPVSQGPVGPAGPQGPQGIPGNAVPHGSTHLPAGIDPIPGIALTNVNNNFSVSQSIVDGVTVHAPSTPIIYLQDNSQPANLKRWRVIVTSQNFYIQPVDDTGNATSDPIILRRNGDVEIGRELRVFGAIIGSAGITGSQFYSISNNPFTILHNTAAAAGQRVYQIVTGGGLLYLRALTDDYSTVLNGEVIINQAGAIRERSRTIPMGEWTNYTPQWLSNGGSTPSVGNGSIAGSYMLVGKTCFFRLYLSVGSTGNGGAGGFYQLTLPIASDWIGLDAFPGWIYTASVNRYHGISGYVYNAAHTIAVVVHGTQGSWHPNNPGAVGPGDQLAMQGMYRIP